MRIDVLFKEHPWVLGLHPCVTQAVTFDVSRLHVAYLDKSAGITRDVEYPSDVFGYFVDQSGRLISCVHPDEVTSPSLWKKLKTKLLCIASHLNVDTYQNIQTIEQAARKLPEFELRRIMYVVIVTRMFYSPQFVNIDFIKLPRGMTMVDMLLAYDDAKATEDRKIQQEAVDALRE